MKVKDVIKEGWGREFAKSLTRQVAPQAYASIAARRGWDKPNTPKSLSKDDPRVQAAQAEIDAAMPHNAAGPIGATGPTGPTGPTGSLSAPLISGVSVIKSSPLTLRYRKHDYLLDRNNQWILLGPKPYVVSDEMQDFLNSEVQKL